MRLRLRCQLITIASLALLAGPSVAADPPEGEERLKAFAFRGGSIFVPTTDNDQILRVAAEMPPPDYVHRVGLAFDGVFWLEDMRNVAVLYADPFARSTPENWSFFRDHTARFPRNSQLLGWNERFSWAGSGGTYVAVRNPGEEEPPFSSTIATLTSIVGFSLEPSKTFDSLTRMLGEGSIADEPSSDSRFERVLSFCADGGELPTIWLWYSPSGLSNGYQLNGNAWEWAYAIKEYSKNRTWLTKITVSQIDGHGFVMPDDPADLPAVYRKRADHSDEFRFLSKDEEAISRERGELEVDEVSTATHVGPTGFRYVFGVTVVVTLLAWFRKRSNQVGEAK